MSEDKKMISPQNEWYIEQEMSLKKTNGVGLKIITKKYHKAKYLYINLTQMT